MAIKLTARTVEAAKPRAEPYELRDAKAWGLVLRVQPSGIKTWYLHWNRGRRVKLGRIDNLSLEGARKKTRAELTEIEKHGEPAPKRKTPHTLGEFITDHYQAHAEAYQRDGKANIKSLKVQFQHLFHKRLQDVNPLLIDKWRREKLEQGRAVTTLNRHLTRLKAVLNKAVEWQMLSANPLRGVKPINSDRRGVVRFLSKEEELRLRCTLRARDHKLIEARRSANRWRAERRYPLFPDLPHYGDHLTPMVLVSMNTGLRRGELVSLTWDRVNIPGRMLTVVGAYSKSGQTRHVPLNAEAVEALLLLGRTVWARGLCFQHPGCEEGVGRAAEGGEHR